MQLPERNAPCPCGSGKKFKKCCGIPKERTPRVWHKEEAPPSDAVLKARAKALPSPAAPQKDVNDPL